jgi:hypothetical protein
MSIFSVQLTGFGVHALDKIDRIKRASCLELFQLVILATPVDTGRARGNWQTTINTPVTGVTARESTSGAESIADAAANLGSLLDVVWFTNNLHYIEGLEMGTGSAQAPEGMLRVNAIKWQQIVAAKAAALG